VDKIWQCMGQTYFEAWALRAELAKVQAERNANVAKASTQTPVTEVPTDVSE
jgi:hypothetical protein